MCEISQGIASERNENHLFWRMTTPLSMIKRSQMEHYDEKFSAFLESAFWISALWTSAWNFPPYSQQAQHRNTWKRSDFTTKWQKSDRRDRKMTHTCRETARFNDFMQQLGVDTDTLWSMQHCSNDVRVLGVTMPHVVRSDLTADDKHVLNVCSAASHVGCGNCGGHWTPSQRLYTLVMPSVRPASTTVS